MRTMHRLASAPALVLLLGGPLAGAAGAAPTEELVVTARKREESLQEVPLSVTAFGADQLQRLGAGNNEDVALLTVNFNTVQQVGRRLDRPTVRGQSAAAVGGEPNASYFVDGAFVSGTISTTTLGPIERVEVLRGPQSAQFGRATFAGAINYVTRRPTNEFSGEVLARAGSHDTRRLSGWVSGPLVRDRLLFFASAGLDQYGGEWRNGLEAGQAPALNFIDPPQQGDASPLGGTDTRDFVGKLLWLPTETTDVTLKLSYTRGDDDHYVQLIQEPGELNCYLPVFDPDRTDISEYPGWYATSKGAFCGTLDGERVNYAAANPFNPANPAFDAATYLPRSDNLVSGLPAQGGARQSRLNLPDFYNGMRLPDFSPFVPGTEPADWVATPEEPGTRRTQRRALLEVDQALGSWTLTARATYGEDDLAQGFDLDRTEQRYFGGTFSMFERAELEDHSIELRLDSPGDRRLRGSLGLYWFESDWKSRQKQFVGQGFGRLGDPTTQSIENRAVFGTVDFDLGERWTLSAEARYANDVKSIASPIACGDDPLTPGLEGTPVSDEVDSDSFTPRLTVRYEPTGNLMFYALAAKGNKPAEFNRAYFRAATADPCESVIAIDSGATRIAEETAWTWEAGSKSSWLSGRLTTNLAFYYIDWTNQSVFQTTTVGGNLTQITRNAGQSEIFGFELETGFRLTDNLTGQFSWGLANGTFVEYADPAYARTTGIGLDENGNLVNDSNNVRGNRLPSAPKHSFVAALDYTRSLSAALDGFARTDFVLETQRYTAPDNFTRLPNRKLWNARIGLEGDRWTLTAWVTNILDLQPPLSVFSFEYLQGLNWNNGLDATGNPDGSAGTSVQAYSVVPAPGRNAGLELVLRFGD